MAISADAIGLLFKIRADSKDAQDDIKRLRKTFDDETSAIQKGGTNAFLKLGESAGLSGERMAQLKTGLTAAASGLAVVGTAAVAAGAAIFAITKNASDAGSEIYEFAQRTNLSTEFLSALKVQAEQSGSSLGSAAASVAKFSNTLVDAARGNQELTRDLKRFGIDAADAYRNPEAALRSFIEQFNKLPPSAANNEAAMRLFKDRTGEVIPVLRSFGTDIDGLMRRLGEMGLLWDREGTEKADEFGDALTELGQVASGAGNVFARDVMPAITSAMREISKAAVENRDKFREWGKGVGDTIRGVRRIMDSEGAGIVGWLARIALEISPVVQLARSLGRLGAEARDADAVKNFGPFGGRGVETPATPGAPAPAPLSPADVTNEAAAKSAESARKKREAEARREAERQAEAIKRIGQAYAEASVRVSGFARDSLQVEAALYKLSIGYNTLTEANKRLAQEEINRFFSAKRELQRLEAAATLQKSLASSIDAAQEAARGGKTHVDAVLEAVGRFVDAGGRADATLQRLTASALGFARNQDIVDGLDRLIEAADKVADVRLPGTGLEYPQGAGQEAGPVVTESMGPPPEMFDRWREFGMTVRGALEEISATSVNAGQMVGGMFQGMAQGMAQSIQGWLLYGGSIGKAVKQALATVLAGIAAESAVKAIFQLAEGFAALFFNPAEAAAHFKAAALYGAAAVAAGVGARAFAGGAAAAGAAYAGGGGGAFGSGGGQANQHEDFRTRYLREQAEKDRYTRKEDRRGESSVVQLIVDGRELGRAVLNHVREGGDLRDGFRNSLGVTG